MTYAPPVQIQSADEVWARIAEAAAATQKPAGAACSPPTPTARCGAATWGRTSSTRSSSTATVHGLRPWTAFKREARDHGPSDAGSGPDVARRILAAYDELAASRRSASAR